MPPDQTPKLHELVRCITTRLCDPNYGTGPLAELRRMDPLRPDAPAFWRLLAGLPEEEARRKHEWALLIHTMALAAPGALGGREELGKTLFDAELKEGRLTRLLQAREEELSDIVPRLVRFIVARRQALNPVALAYFIRAIREGDQAADKTRERIARAYYKAEYQAEKSAHQIAQAEETA